MELEFRKFETLTEVLEDLEKQHVSGYQKYKALNRYVILKARYHDIPVKGSFELTPFCNLDCKMCYVHLKPNQIGQNEGLLTVEEWKRIMSQAVDAGMVYATLTGGECLTYPGFKEVYLHLYSLGIQPDILTNGRLLTEEMLTFFKKYPPGSIQVTLYGSSEEAYEEVTGHRVFQQVIDGIERAKEARLNLVLAVTPSRYMQNDVERLLDKVHSFNVPYAISDTTLKARAETERDLADYAVELDTMRKIKLIEKEYSASQKSIDQVINPIEYVPVKKKALKGLQCGGAHSSFHVNWRGEVCPCIGFAPSVHYSALEAGFAEAWECVKQAMLQFAPPDECKDCRLKEYCVTCPAEKTQSVLNGRLDCSVCKRLKQYLIDREAYQADACTLI